MKTCQLVIHQRKYMELVLYMYKFIFWFSDVLCVTVVSSQKGWGVSYTSTEICAIRGSTVDINCTYTYPSRWNNLDNTVQETFWFIQEIKRIHVDLRTDLKYSGRVEYLCGNNKCTLRISNLGESDSVVYKFRFTTNQPTGSFTGFPGAHSECHR